MLMRQALTPTEEDRRLAQLGRVLFTSVDVTQAVDLSETPEEQRLDKALEAYGHLSANYKRLEQAFEHISGVEPKTGLDLVEEILQLRKEVQHWKSNHDNQVEKTRLLLDRTDLPVERVQAYRKVETMEQQALIGREALQKVARWDVPPRTISIPHRQIMHFRDLAVETLGRMLAFDTPLQREVERLQAWIDDLQTRKGTSCLYCGMVLPREAAAETQESMRTLMRRHILHCKKHPIREMLVRFRQFVMEIEAPSTGRNRELYADAERYFESLDGQYQP